MRTFASWSQVETIKSKGQASFSSSWRIILISFSRSRVYYKKFLFVEDKYGFCLVELFDWVDEYFSALTPLFIINLFGKLSMCAEIISRIVASCFLMMIGGILTFALLLPSFVVLFVVGQVGVNVETTTDILSDFNQVEWRRIKHFGKIAPLNRPLNVHYFW